MRKSSKPENGRRAIEWNCTFILILALLVTTANAPAQNMPWQPDQMLTWADFQGKPDAGSSFLAYTAYTLGYSSKYDQDGKITVSVTCSFDKSKSWKTPDNKLTDKLLLHEQLHFYVAEIYARKMRKAFHEYAATHKAGAGTSADLDKIFIGLMHQSHDYNDQYDIATNHSTIAEKQEEWRKKITGELNALDAYAVK